MSGSRVYRRGEGKRSDHEKTLPFVGRVLVQVRLYWERERGGGKTDRDRENQDRRQENPRSSTRTSIPSGEDEISYQEPPPPTPTNKYYQPHRSGRENLQALGRWADRQGQQGIGQKSVGKADRRTAGDHRC